MPSETAKLGRPQSHHICGVSFDDVSSATLIKKIIEGTTDPFWYITTPNVDHLVRLQDNKRLLKLHENSSVTICDSRILRLLYFLIYGRLIRILRGSDLTASLFEGLKSGISRNIVIVGGESEQVERLISDYDLHTVVHRNPPYGFVKSVAEIKSIVRWVEHQKPSIIFVAVGSPQQEVVAYLLRRRKKARGVGLCAGASIDFLTGKEQRAPILLRKAHLEWLYRSVRNPRRMARRYLVNGPRIIGILLRDRFSN